MHIQVLIDNIAKEPLQNEWGLSVYIEYEGKKVLLDTGASSRLQKMQKPSAWTFRKLIWAF